MSLAWQGSGCGLALPRAASSCQESGARQADQPTDAGVPVVFEHRSDVGGQESSSPALGKPIHDVFDLALCDFLAWCYLPYALRLPWV